MKLNKIAMAMLLCSPAFAESECEYIDMTHVKTIGNIEQTRNYEQETAHYAEEKRVCAVKIDVKIGKNWVKTQDFYVFGPEMSQNDACNKAKDKAKIKALEKFNPQVVTNNVKQQCKDSIVLNKIPEKKYEPNPESNSLACNLINLFYSGPEKNSRCSPIRQAAHNKLGMENLKPGVCRDYKREEVRDGRVWTIGGKECLQKDGTWFAVF